MNGGAQSREKPRKTKKYEGLQSVHHKNILLLLSTT